MKSATVKAGKEIFVGNLNMENALFIALSKQAALQNGMTIVSNNIANMNTAGYRGQNIMFHELVERPNGHSEAYSYVSDFGQYDNTDPGPIQKTANPLDIALVGPGFIGVENNQETHYTRAGHFSLKPDGTLVTPSGNNVLSANGGPIVIPDNVENIAITNEGVILADDEEIAQLMVVEFDEPQKLTPVGKVLYKTDEVPTPAQDTVVQQGFVEGSNVNGIIEMTRLIEVSRTYTRISQIVSDEDERQRTAIRQLLSGQ